MIRGSDGLEYADEAALLLREPLDNTFNGNVQSYRKVAERYLLDPSLLRHVPAGRAYWTEERVRKYIEGFLSVCPEGYPGPCGAYGAAHNTGLEAAGFCSRRQALDQASQRLANYIDRAAFAVLSGKPPTFAISDDFGTITIDTAVGDPTLSVA